MEIREYNKKDEEKRKIHLNKHLKSNQIRVTFFRDEDELGFRFYRFVGVFKLNKEKLKKENKCVWERISDTYYLNI